MAIGTSTTIVKSKTCNFYNGNGCGSESSSRCSSGSSSPSPPPSPRRHSSFFHSRRSKSRREGFAAGILLPRRIRYFLVLPFLYVSGLIMCVGSFSGFVGHHHDLPGSMYRSHEMFQKLWPDIESDNSSTIELSPVWKYKRRVKEHKPCPNATAGLHLFGTDEESTGPSGYLIVEANGGLNQQRSAICNAVAVAKLLNAILVIPQLEFHGIWRDSSEFGDIYDEDHFIATLEGHVKVVKELPDVLMERYSYNITNIPNFRAQAWAPVSYYLREVYPMLHEQGAIRMVPFANRLAMHVPPHIQLIRCLTNFEALRFSSSISSLAKKLINRMIEKSSRTGGEYVSVHLRFEEDMVAFSCCVYEGGEAEKTMMDSIREQVWKKKFKQNSITIPGLNRIDGKCPLTPLEVGMMLRGMGFHNNTSIYIASGKIYQAERHLTPLLKMFPLVHFKESLATPDELAPFRGYSSRLAALDYMVSLYSEVFVTTQGGNFPHFLMGHRRFLYDGHAKTIQPDKRKLVVLLQDTSISWKAFKLHMEEMLVESDRKGLMVPRVKKINRKTSIYKFPLPECQCLQHSHNSTLELIPTPNILDYHLDSTR